MLNQKMLCDCEVIHEDIVDKVKRNMLLTEELERLEKFFKIFGNDTRLNIISALDQHEMCVCDLAVLLKMTKSAISHQLRELRDSHLVKSRRDGKVIYYSLNDKHIKDVFEVGLEHIRHTDDKSK